MKYGIFFAIVEQIVPPISATDIILRKKIYQHPCGDF